MTYLVGTSRTPVERAPVRIAAPEDFHDALVDNLQDLDVDVECVCNGGTVVSTIWYLQMCK